MSDKLLRVSIIGCGDLGQTHARCWAKIPEAQVIAVADLQEFRARKLADEFDLRDAFTNYRQAIDLPEVNVVSICIPTNLHAPAAIYAAERGRHVLTEKPVALDLAQTDAMIAAARQHGIQFSVGLMRYHSPVLSEIKAWLDRNGSRRPAIYWASDIREVRPKREMHDQNANGGPVIDMAVHVFATWQALFNSKPVEVYAHGFTFAQNRPELAHIAHKAVDTATLSVRYESGDVGNFLVSWGVPPGVVPAPLPEMLLTAEGVLHMTFDGNHQQATWQKEGGDWETIAVSNESMYQREIRDFADAILHNRPPLVSAGQGRDVLRISLAALESIRLGAPVKINHDEPQPV